MRAVCGGWITLVLALAACAQDPLQLRSRTGGLGAVTLDVVMRDGAGQPVSGLGPGDFVVRDNGQIVASTKVQVARESPQLLFVLDTVNSTFAETTRGVDGLQAFLKTRPARMTTPVTILILSDTNPEERLGATAGKTGDTRALQKRRLFVHRIPPSADPAELMQALRNYKPALPSILTAQGGSGDVERVQLSLQALSFLTKAETPAPGAKLMVWISPGWPFVADFDRSAREKIFDSVIYFSDLLRVGRTVLYAVDPEGVTANNVTAGYRYLEYRKGVSKVDQSNPNDLTLQVLAYQSGGLVLPNSNDLGRQLQQCAADAEAMYSMSYQAEPGTGRDEYHGISVKLARDGQELRTRTGFYSR